MYTKSFLRFSIITLLIFLFSLSIASASCSLGFENNCQIITQGDFTAVVEGEYVEESNLEIAPKHYIDSHSVKQESNQVRNALSYPGVYEAFGSIRNSGGALNSLSPIEFVFDNSQPHQPRVSPIIYGDFEINHYYSQDEVIIENNQGELMRTSDDEVSLNLDSPEFITLTTKRNNLYSEPLRRFYYPEEPSYNPSLPVSSISLDTSTINEINNVEQGKTRQRDFFVTGDVQSENGAIVYVNGQPTPVQNGVFGAFVPLNDGNNKIEVIADNQQETYEISYDSTQFQFSQLDVEKLTNDNSVQIQGKTTNNKEFDVYVNGVYKQTINPTGNEFSVTLSEISSKTTLLQLKGYDGAYYDTIIYQSQEDPTVESHHFLTQTNEEEIAFKITDAIGVDESSIELSINGQSHTRESFERKGDFYTLESNQLSDGTHSYTLSVKNRLGGETQYQGEIIIDSNFLNPEDVLFQNARNTQLGSHVLFGSKEGIEMSFEMEEGFAFKSLRLDGVDQNEYRIYSDNSLRLSLNSLEDKGEITLVYIDEQRNQYERTFSYKVLPVKEITLEAISLPSHAMTNAPQLGRGFIENSSYVNKDTIEFNEFNPIWFGDDFEAYIPQEDSLEIRGRDILGRTILFNNQKTNSPISIHGRVDNEIGKFIKLNNELSPANPTLLLNRIGDTSFKHTVFGNGLKIPSSQIQGLRGTIIEGVDLSGQKFSTYSLDTVDVTKPQLYRDGNKVIIDGIYSKIDEYEINHRYSTCASTSTQECISVSDSVTGLTIEAEDKSGNEIEKEIILDELPLYEDKFVSESKLYFTRNEKTTTNDLSIVQGQFIAAGEVKEISSSKGICEYDTHNFVCAVELEDGTNTIDVTLSTKQDQTTQSYTIEKQTKDVSVSIDGVRGDEVFEFGGVTYYIGGNLRVDGDVSDSGQIIIEVDGRPITIEDGTSLSYEIGEYLEFDTQDYTQRELEIQARYRDETGHEEVSNTFTVFYTSVRDVFLSVILN